MRILFLCAQLRNVKPLLPCETLSQTATKIAVSLVPCSRPFQDIDRYTTPWPRQKLRSGTTERSIPCGLIRGAAPAAWAAAKNWLWNHDCFLLENEPFVKPLAAQTLVSYRHQSSSNSSCINMNSFNYKVKLVN